jgi:cytidine deaminase
MKISKGSEPVLIRDGIYMKWDVLIKKATDAKEMAYAPYSDFHVGAAVLTPSGRVFSGCNVENASYGATICAERAAIIKAVSEGEKKISAIAIISDSNDLTFPCGICRQVIAEFADSQTKIICCDRNGNYIAYEIADILPNAFTKKNLIEE